MNDPITIAVLASTIRPNRRSHKVAEYIADYGRQQAGVEIIYVDPMEFNFSHDGDDDQSKDPRYSQIVERADGFLIVTPEYNHSFPGTLKKMLDTEFDNYYHKAVALCGVSSGDWGGTRAVESLISVCKAIGLVIARNSANIPHVTELFNEDGSLSEARREKVDKAIAGVYSELIWLTQALKSAKNSTSNQV